MEKIRFISELERARPNMSKPLKKRRNRKFSKNIDSQSRETKIVVPDINSEDKYTSLKANHHDFDTNSDTELDSYSVPKKTAKSTQLNSGPQTF